MPTPSPKYVSDDTPMGRVENDRSERLWRLENILIDLVPSIGRLESAVSSIKEDTTELKAEITNVKKDVEALKELRAIQQSDLEVLKNADQDRQEHRRDMKKVIWSVLGAMVVAFAGYMLGWNGQRH
jgi:chromosome segregation ATPase